MNYCKFCNKAQKNPLSYGYCVKCYQYFILNGYDTYYPSQYGEINRVEKQDSKQYRLAYMSYMSVRLLLNYNSIYIMHII